MKGNADFWQIVWPATNAVFFNDFDQNRPQNPIFFLASQGGRGGGSLSQVRGTQIQFSLQGIFCYTYWERH